jgi:hypothetical protein
MVSVAAGKKKRKHSIVVAKPSPTLVAGLDNKTVYIAVAALIVAVGLCYASALSNGFVFDDHFHVLEDKSFRSLSNVPKLLVASYRPLRDITYALDFALWGERAFGFHLTSIVMHLVNTVLVFFLVRRLSGWVLGASLAAMVFAVQPIQVDSVGYISGRRDVLFSLFFLLSFLCYLAYRRVVGSRRGRHYRLRASFFFALFGVCWGPQLAVEGNGGEHAAVHFRLEFLRCVETGKRLVDTALL